MQGNTFIKNKGDLQGILLKMRRDLQEICKTHFRYDLVTEENWERSPDSRVSFHKSKIPMLTAAGVMKDTSEFEYGWHFRNEHYAKCANSLYAADKLIVEMLDFMAACNIWPKREATGMERGLFQVIEGGGKGSWAFQQLREGVGR